MRPLILFLATFVLSSSLVLGLVIYTSPVDDNNILIWQALLPVLAAAAVAVFSLSTSLFFLSRRLFELILKRKPWSDQKLNLKRFWRSSIRRGALTAILVSALISLKVFNINNQLNIALVISIVVLAEILLWRYYVR